MIKIGLFDRIRAMEERFAAITSKIRKAFAGMSNKAFEGLVDEAVVSARGGARRSRRAPR